jgi:hypothetical protein
MFLMRMILLHELSHITGAELVDGPPVANIYDDRINRIVQDKCRPFLLFQ